MRLLPLIFLLGPAAFAQDGTFDGAIQEVENDLTESAYRLNDLVAEIEAARLPLERELTSLERTLSSARAEYNEVAGEVNARAVELLRLRDENKTLLDQAEYITGLFSEFSRNFDSSLLIAERERYQDRVDAANLAMENSNLDAGQVFEAQVALFDLGVGRLVELMDGVRFEGTALDAEGLVQEGEFLLVGPVALFAAGNGGAIGLTEQRVNSQEAAIVPFGDEAETEQARTLMRTGNGLLPFDPTLGNAAKIEATEETFIEHVKKGGAVMIPIFAMAGAALLVALFKWIALQLQRKPSRKKVEELFLAVGEGEEEEIQRKAAAVKGPVGNMLRVGVDHLKEPKELVEEAMFETVLTTKLRLQRFLPFIAISAASAPLLGLLGTVTGIINTFKMITVYGSGDVKSLSGGISEALITTKFGLIVAIPSLLLHAFLSRKARGISDEMETTALAFVNQVGRSSVTPQAPKALPSESLGGSPDPDLVRAQVNEILSELLANDEEQASHA